MIEELIGFLMKFYIRGFTRERAKTSRKVEVRVKVG